jgi:DNA polymerase-3 subunit epsilon
MSNLIIGLDTETTGIPDWQKPSGDDCQPHLTQLAAVVMEEDTRKIIQSMDVIIKPDGWVIPPECVELNGITTEYAMEVGIPEQVAIDMFMCLWNHRLRVAFNTTFDNRIIRIATKRYMSEEIQNDWKGGKYECAMIAARKDMGGKNPKLVDAYKHYTGKELEGAHTAMADTLACMEVYFAIKDKG